MAEIKAGENPIFVNNPQEKIGTTTIHYQKEKDQELWEKMNGGTWEQIKDADLHGRTKTGDIALSEGTFIDPITLKPGETYEIAVYAADQGPLSGHADELYYLKVFCLWKLPEVRDLISELYRQFGGTWCQHDVLTRVPTSIVKIGVSLDKPKVDINGIPQLQNPGGRPTPPLVSTNKHRVEIKPLFPGNKYYFVVVVADVFGNWEVRQEEFTTLQRKITVEFKTLHIYDDGDDLGKDDPGEAQFWFRVYKKPENESDGNVELITFHRPQQDVQEWGDPGGHSYPLVGFVYYGSFEKVEPAMADVGIESWGVEHDEWPQLSELASEFNAPPPPLLPFPAGRFAETSINIRWVDCPASSGSFHYGVDVVWFAEYGP